MDNNIIIAAPLRCVRLPIRLANTSRIHQKKKDELVRDFI